MKRNIFCILIIFVLLAHVSSRSLIKNKLAAKTKVKNKLHQSRHQTSQQTRTDSRDVTLAQYSNDIYDGCPDGNTLCQEEQGHSVRFALIQNDEGCFVIIRGTQNWDNWKSDLDFPLVDNPYGLGMVHQGFLDIMQNIEGIDGYNSFLDGCVSNEAYIGFTGHSLGGAVATLAARQFKHNHPDYTNYHYATFGSPRVGNYYWQQDFISVLSHMGNRYESVKAPRSQYWGLSTFSPCGDHALPGDVIPRVPPMTPPDRKVAEWILDITLPSFWSGSSDAVNSFLGLSDDDDYSRDNGYRHVGYRYQLSCDSINYISCHSMTNVYLPAIRSNSIRDC